MRCGRENENENKNEDRWKGEGEVVVRKNDKANEKWERGIERMRMRMRMKNRGDVKKEELNRSRKIK